MNTEPTPPAENFSKDLETFEQLPAKTKDLVTLKDVAEKTTGQPGVKLTHQIRKKGTQLPPPRPSADPA